MLGFLVGAIIVAATIVSGETRNWERSLRDVSTEEHSHRQGKFFPLFSVVRFANNVCLGNNNLNGTCFTSRECKSYGGTSSGSCANGLGVCCVFRNTCGTSTNMNNTYFVNPGYPITYQGGERCTLEISRCNSDICQLRIDFLEFKLAQPNISGICDHDFLLVARGSTIVPRICGDNSNQHVYVEFNGGNPITLSIVTDPDYAFDRRWNLRIQQIACDSAWRAPNGCLQYYKTVMGTVSSFNYGTEPNPRGFGLLVPSTRQMQYLNYGVCVRMALGYCTIEWSQSDSVSFAISNDTSVLDPTTDLGSEFAESGTRCDHNFIIIPNPSVSGTRLNVDRFCGNGFSTATSSSKPFVMYVVTNPEEPGMANDYENLGFVMKYRQIPCTI